MSDRTFPIICNIGTKRFCLVLQAGGAGRLQVKESEIKVADIAFFAEYCTSLVSRGESPITGIVPVYRWVPAVFHDLHVMRMRNKKYIVADSGSTKTDWVLGTSQEAGLKCRTRGINPFMLDVVQIEQILREDLPAEWLESQVDEICFYGAGCRGDRCQVVGEALRRVWPQALAVEVQSDLLGAAHALFPSGDGIACILGTGSNSGLYVSGRLASNVSPLGYVLGDEGSGAVLGRRLLGDVMKQQLPRAVQEDFWATYDLTPDAVITRVYREPMPNRFLASFAPFLHRHRQVPEVHALLVEEFVRFFRRNVALYGRPDLPVSFVGSIAYFFQAELAEAASVCGFRLGTVRREPLA